MSENTTTGRLSLATIGDKTKDIEFSVGEDLSVIFEQNGVTVSETQSIEVDGKTVTVDYVPQPGEIVNIVPNAGNG